METPLATGTAAMVSAFALVYDLSESQMKWILQLCHRKLVSGSLCVRKEILEPVQGRAVFCGRTEKVVLCRIVRMIKIEGFTVSLPGKALLTDKTRLEIGTFPESMLSDALMAYSRTP